MDSLARRIAARYSAKIKTARWDNGANSTYYSIKWNKSLWQVEESDSPLSSTRDLDLPSKLETYTLPTLIKELRGQSEWVLVDLSPTLIYRYFHLGEDKGPAARAKILKGYEDLFDDLIRGFKDEDQGDALKLSTLEKLLPTLRRKLVWKKTS